MVCENDKLNIPEKYLSMSASELKKRKETEWKKIEHDRESGKRKFRKKAKSKLVINWN